MNLNDSKNSLFSDKEFTGKLLRYALPISFQALMLALVAATDAFMLGSVEQNSMSAVSLATQIQFLQNMFIMSVVAAGSILGAQYWGKGDKQTVNDIFIMILRVSAVLSLIFFGLCIIFPRQLMLIYTNEEILVEIGVQYLRLAGWSYLLTGFSQCYLTMMKVTDHPNHTAMISSGAVIINVILNAVFIYGFFGIVPMGAKGAALATLIARVIEVVWCIAVSYKKDFIHPDFRRLFHRDALLEKDFVKCLWPLLGAFLFWGVGFSSYSAFMGHLGTDAAAANSIAAVVRDLVCCLCEGAANAAGIVVGNELGAGKLDKGKEYGIKCAKISFILGAVSTAIMLIVTPIVSRAVKLTPEARELLVGMMVIMAVYMIGRAVNSVIINGIFAAGGDTLFDMYSLAVCMWGLAVPLAAAGTFLFHWPILVVYACTCLDEVGKIPWVLYHFRKYKWVKDLTR